MNVGSEILRCSLPTPSSAARCASPRRSTCLLSCLDASSTETNMDTPCALEATRVRHRPRAHGHHGRPAPHCEPWSDACTQEPGGHGSRSGYQGDIIPAIAVGQPSRMLRPPHLALPCSSCAKPAAMQACMYKAPPCLAAWHGLCSHRCYRRATTRPVARMTSAAVQGQSLSVLGGSVCEDAAGRALLRCPRFRS